MALLHSCLVARVRHPAEGEEPHEIVAQATGISGLGTVAAPVVAAYHDLMSSKPEAVEARRRYSHVVLIVDNGHRANHEFPDLDAAEAKKAKSADIREAAEEKRRSEARAASLKKQLAEAEETESKAAARLANLTGAPVDPEPIILPQEEEGDQGAVDADPKGGTPAAAPPTGPSPAIDPAATGASATSGAEGEGDPVAKMAARLSAHQPVTPDDLAALTVPQLKALAAHFGIAIPGDAKKDDIIADILVE